MTDGGSLVLTFGVSRQGGEYDGARVAVERAIGLQPEDLPQIELVTGGDARFHVVEGARG